MQQIKQEQPISIWFTNVFDIVSIVDPILIGWKFFYRTCEMSGWKRFFHNFQEMNDIWLEKFMQSLYPINRYWLSMYFFFAFSSWIVNAHY